VLRLCPDAADTAKAAMGSRNGKVSDLEEGNTENLPVGLFKRILKCKRFHQNRPWFTWNPTESGPVILVVELA
jgi:hypothetical protein